MAKFEKGWKGGPGRPRMTEEQKAAAQIKRDIREMAMEHVDVALAALVVNLSSPTSGVSAAKEILDRAFGKPVAKNEHSGPDGQPIPISVNVNFVPTVKLGS